MSKKTTVADEVMDNEQFLMYLEANRLKSFTDKGWPFDDEKSEAQATSVKMAAAGFYFCPTDNEPDLVKCFMCCKELDGWEPTDDPWAEHLSHSGHCEFLAQKKIEDMTIEEFLKSEGTRQANRVQKAVEARIKEFETFAAEARKEIESLGEMEQ